MIWPMRHRASPLVVMLSLTGCASLGGNINGDFSCAAPDGICAPSSVIDDRALALISGEVEPTGLAPAGPYRGKSKAGRPTPIAAHVEPVADGSGARTSERVLRIIFQPHIDARGRLHEASAVRTVVAQGEWQNQAVLGATEIPPVASAAASPGSEPLVLALDRAEQDASSPSSDLVTSPMPTPASIAAARAKGSARQPAIQTNPSSDPIMAIEEKVAARLATAKSRSRTIAGDGAPSSSPAPAPTSALAEPKAVAADRSAVAGRGAAPRQPRLPVLKGTPAGNAAGERALADPRIVDGAQRLAREAKAAPSTAGAPPKIDLKTKISAAGFPGAVAVEE